MSTFIRQDPELMEEIIENIPRRVINNYSVMRNLPSIYKRMSVSDRRTLGNRIVDEGNYSQDEMLELLLIVGALGQARLILDHKDVNDNLHPPSFIIVGAMRSGTSWLSVALRKHPVIWMLQFEPFYFSNNPLQYSLDEYMALFIPGNHFELTGEKSSNYDLFIPEIRQTFPDTKLIYIVRDPFDRLVSHYFHTLKRGYPHSFLEFIDADFESCLERGMYFENVPMGKTQNRLLILFFEDLAEQPERLLNQVLDYLDVCQDSIRSLLPKRKINVTRHSTSKSYKEILIDRGLEARLKALYRPNIENLSNMLNRDLSKWMDW